MLTETILKFQNSSIGAIYQLKILQMKFDYCVALLYEKINNYTNVNFLRQHYILEKYFIKLT